MENRELIWRELPDGMGNGYYAKSRVGDICISKAIDGRWFFGTTPNIADAIAYKDDLADLKRYAEAWLKQQPLVWHSYGNGRIHECESNIGDIRISMEKDYWFGYINGVREPMKVYNLEWIKRSFEDMHFKALENK